MLTKTVKYTDYNGNERTEVAINHNTLVTPEEEVKVFKMQSPKRFR